MLSRLLAQRSIASARMPGSGSDHMAGRRGVVILVIQSAGVHENTFYPPIIFLKQKNINCHFFIIFSEP